MRPIAIDFTRSVVCVSVYVCVLGTQVSCTETDEPIKMSFGCWIRCAQGNKY